MSADTLKPGFRANLLYTQEKAIKKVATIEEGKECIQSGSSE
jgi:hypothetical protein